MEVQEDPCYKDRVLDTIANCYDLQNPKAGWFQKKRIVQVKQEQFEQKQKLKEENVLQYLTEGQSAIPRKPIERTHWGDNGEWNMKIPPKEMKEDDFIAKNFIQNKRTRTDILNVIRIVKPTKQEFRKSEPPDMHKVVENQYVEGDKKYAVHGL